MATYRTIRMSFWNDPAIESLPPADKLLYLYLFTCPHANNLGVLSVSLRKMAFETGSNSYLQALRRAAKQTLYMYLHVRVTNRDYAESIGDTAALRHDFKPAVLGWRHLVALIDLVAVALFALAIRGIVRDVKLYKAAKAARAENKNG